ncbi:site-2 protease family protein [Candidatus Woesearchaeota archaeon]|nr:site-2 protease family protein [Candidatus Woesearchaeota archaeon]
MSFISQYGSVIIFYAAIIGIIYANRKKFDFPAKLIAMYRTKIGIRLMHKWGEGAERFIKALALIGIYVGFAGMLLACWLIIKGWFNLLFVPEAPAMFAPVLPGVKIPGVDVFIPFWYGIIALFLTIVVHEFSHGVVAAAHRLKVKHSGFVMFGPLPGAFVEPDEKQLMKAKPKVQLGVYAAGPFSNILLTLILILAFGFLPFFAANLGGGSEGLERFTEKTSITSFTELFDELYRPAGLPTNAVPGGAAAEAGVMNGTVVKAINGVEIYNLTAFIDEYLAIANLTPGDTITLSNATHDFIITTRTHPDNESRAYLGVFFDWNAAAVEPDPAAQERFGPAGFKFREVAFWQVFWLIVLSSGIGLANLLPIGPVDGGRMFLIALERVFPEERARKLWGKVSAFVLISIIILVLAPIIKHLLF